MFNAKDMIAAFEAHLPATLDFVSKAVDYASKDLGFLRLAEDPWSMLENISIDYALWRKHKLSCCSIYVKVV